jgi:cleavage and polyadenylation specificity factor subunit 1
MMDFTARVAGCKFFSKIDLRKGYHQIPMHPADIQKTAIVTPFGLYEFTRMTFGMRNAGCTFQRLMDRVLAAVKAAFAYLDDVLVASATLEQHLEDLRQVFTALQEAGLVINGEKCLYAVQELDFLGHRVSPEGIRPLPDRVAALRRHPRPLTVRQLQGFLGMVNFYRRFLPSAARILRPLTDALRGGAKPSAAVDWTPAMQSAFDTMKEALAAATLLAHPEPRAQLSLVTDASADHVGAALQPGLRSRGILGRLRLRSRSKFSRLRLRLLLNLRGPSDFAWYISWSAGRIFSCFKNSVVGPQH